MHLKPAFFCDSQCNANVSAFVLAASMEGQWCRWCMQDLRAVQDLRAQLLGQAQELVAQRCAHGGSLDVPRFTEARIYTCMHEGGKKLAKTAQ